MQATEKFVGMVEATGDLEQHIKECIVRMGIEGQHVCEKVAQAVEPQDLPGMMDAHITKLRYLRDDVMFLEEALAKLRSAMM